MRQIKFRVWDMNTKKMCEVGEILFEVKHGIGPNDTATYVMPPYESRYRVIGKDAELMQFTGLQDRNGKDIYEGDIVDYLDNTSQGLVKKTAAIEDLRHLPDFTCSKWQEVIGNIWEAPNLLSKEQ